MKTFEKIFAKKFGHLKNLWLNVIFLTTKLFVHKI